MHRPVTLVGVVVLAMAAGAVAFAQDAKVVERGKQVYTEQKCKLCHSIGAEGNSKGPLDDTGNKLTAAQIKEWLVNPKEMTAKTKAPMFLKEVCRAWNTARSWAPTGCRGCCLDGVAETSETTRSPPGNGSPLNRPPLTTQKTVVLRPMPSPSVTTATSDSAG